ncbi:MAG: MFS transporter [Gammaproteobacteria bacterium]
MDRDNSSIADPAPADASAAPLSINVLYVGGALALIATVISAVVPAFVGTWQTQYGIGADQAAFIAAAEFFAQVVGAGVFILAARRWSWRQCAVGGLLIIILGNLAAAASPHVDALVPARAVAGVGGGMLRALGMTCLARARSPGLAFALYATAQVAIAAILTAMLPTIVGVAGAQTPFMAMAAIGAAAVFSARLLPNDKAVAARWNWRDARRPRAAASFAVAALFIYFAGQGALWTFLEPIGKSQSIEQAGITRALTLLNIAGLVGSFGVGALAHKMNPVAALAALLCLGLVSVLALFNAHTSTAFIAAACGFYFAWCASFPFQFTIIARADATGTASATVPAVDTLGLASGAALAGMCLPRLGVTATGWAWAACSLIGFSCFVMAARTRRIGVNRCP